jgi:peptidoglycan/xylan/chitin deacetylase (PgdA/CDA1 family)
MRPSIIFLFLLTLSLPKIFAQENQAVTFQWPEGVRAAVCLTYDDGLDCHLDVAMPALEKYGLKGTFYATGFSSSLFVRMEEWRSWAAKGYEIGNHTLFHPCQGDLFDWIKPEYDLNRYTIDQIRNELRTANTLLTAIDGEKERSFAYTCGNYTIDGLSFIDSIRFMFPSARGAGKELKPIDQVDAHYVPSWGVADPTGEELIDYVKKANEMGTIAVFMFHSVGGGYLNVSAEAHEQLLEYLQQNREKVWTDTFLNVMEYVKAQSY